MIQPLDGKVVANGILEKVQEDISKNTEVLKKNLGIILIGSALASQKYIEMKKKACERLGIKVTIKKFEDIENAKQQISDWNKNDEFGGLFVQLPLPDKFKDQTQDILNLIDPKKDVDGLTAWTLGNLVVSKNVEKNIKPATVEAVLQILKFYKIPVKSENICIIGASNVVGMPLQICLNRMGATTTLCHEFTKNLEVNFKRKAIVISAVGEKGLIDLKNVESETVLIDIGVSFENGKIYGDIDWDWQNESVLENQIHEKSLKITPPVGGVGPVTVSCLIQNFINLALRD